MTDDKDRPIIAAWGVVDDDKNGKLVYVSMEKRYCVEIARRTSTSPNRRLVKLWVRVRREDDKAAV